MLRCPAISVLPSFLPFILSKILLKGRSPLHPAISLIVASVIFHFASSYVESLSSTAENYRSTEALQQFTQPSLRILVLFPEQESSVTSISQFLEEAVIKWRSLQIPRSRLFPYSKAQSPWYSFSSTTDDNNDSSSDFHVRNISVTKVIISGKESPSSLLESICRSITESQAVLLLSFVSEDASFLSGSCAAAANLPLLSIQDQQDSSSVFLQVSDSKFSRDSDVRHQQQTVLFLRRDTQCPTNRDVCVSRLRNH